MASQPPIPPPTALAGASAKAKIDQIAVRLILVPDGARNASQPTKLSGTVAGQTPDGSLNITTDKGDIRILLKDRGSLPQGFKIEIEIPAGRNPQQANIRASESSPLSQPSQASSSPAPSLAQAVANQPSTSPVRGIKADARIPQQAPLPPPVKLQPDTLRDVISSAELKITTDKSLPLPIAGGNLQAGQMVRLLPVPPNSMPQNIVETFAKPASVSEIITNLVQQIENIPKEHIQLRTTLTTMLSRMDFSALTPAKPPSLPLVPPNAIQTLPTAQSPTSTHTTQAPTQLIAKIDSLIQSIGLPPIVKNNANISSPSQILTPMSLFNPSKSIDGQIFGFQNISPTAGPANVIAPPPATTPISPSQVIGFTGNGLPVLSVPLPDTGLTQIYTMQFKADNIQAGTPIFIALDPASIKPTQILLIQAADGTISLDQNLSPATLNDWINSGTWDSMDDVLKNLTHIAPAHAQSFAQMIPNPAQPHSMPALSLFFLSLLRTGDTDGWIANEAVALLRQMGKADLLRSVTSDMAVAGKLEHMLLPQDWRMTMLPLLWDNQIHKAPLYYKHLPDEQDKDGADAKKRHKLRFLFDLNMSRMGGVQVDGFMQSERLDLILRTKSPLSRAMQSEMKRIYAGAMDKSRLTGDLSFQFKPEQWVDLSQSPEKTGLHA